MDNRLKQRLIGAFVIVVLAVIFVPYLLEEPAEPEQPVANLESPPRPEQDFTKRTPPAESSSPENDGETLEESPATAPELPKIELMGLKPRPSMTTVDITEAEEPGTEQATRAEAERAQRARAEAERAQQARAEAERAQRARAEAERAEAERAEAERAEAERAEAERAEAERAEAERAQQARAEAERTRAEAKPDIVLPKIELVGKPSSDGGTATPPPTPMQTAAAERFGWLVQAGSFSRRNNAYELRDRLRTRGFKAFVEDARETGRTLYRVRIGPQLSRAESENILARLQREVGINGLVLAPE